MDKAILLQKQVRENSEDFQKEIRDMVAWEEEMKRKDFEIRNSNDDQELPPVRSKKKNKPEPISDKSNDEDKQKIEKTIAESDYKSCDKFNIDEAVKEVDGTSKPKEEETKEIEMKSKEELEKAHEEATKYKDEGNALVQERLYISAIREYNKAIRIYPHDPVYYANRALCQFNLDNPKDAEADCTEAIKLDENYVKAYYRRAIARMSLEIKRYEDAKTDLEKVLKLEPSNKQAAFKLEQVEDIINNPPKPLTEKEIKERNELQQRISNNFYEKNRRKTYEERRKELIITRDLVRAEKKQNLIDAQKKQPAEDELPPWLPKLKDGCSFVIPSIEMFRPDKIVLKKTIEITEIPENESIFKGIVEEIPIEEKIVKVDKPDPQNVKNVIKNENTSNDKPNTEDITNLPLPPKTSVRFFRIWHKSESIDFKYKYLKQIEPKNFPRIIKASMESNVLSDIIMILNVKFVSNGDNVYDWLFFLSKLERFRALTLFMTQADKEALKSLLEYCKTKEGKTNDELNELHTAFEL